MNEYYKKRFFTIIYYLSTICIISGVFLLLPVLIGLIYREPAFEKLVKGFLLPGTAGIFLGLIGRIITKPDQLFLKDSMFICASSWVILTLLGGIPYVFLLKTSYINGCFEAMSGFTTTGITVLTGLDHMPRSILFWRALTQWIGGLGILSMFVILGFKGGASPSKLFMAESHKIKGAKPAPGIFHTAKVLWKIYIIFTLAEITLLIFLRLDLFDAVTHTFTTISTGGFSIYDSSIAYFRQAGYIHHHLIEVVIIIFMILGGMNFLTHYRILKGNLKAFFDSSEMRYFWMIILFGISFIFLRAMINTDIVSYQYNGVSASGVKAILLHIKDITFQCVSILTTTGFATRDINEAYFGAFARQIFLIFMVIGGCAGSTGGGVKVIRIAILTKLIRNRIYRIDSSRLARLPLTIDGQIIDDDEIKRVFTIFFVWILLLIAGGLITAFFSNLSGWQSFSGMFSALGNIGPCYISVREMINLHPVIKLTYITGMLAGRLEIIPILIFFNRRFFK
ncbi:MAG: TrkH family potassium uptake protein [Spirochaetes bacterium]|nr:TrkH family potassium uptake protein [Spirochaetota bacterium]